MDTDTRILRSTLTRAVLLMSILPVILGCGADRKPVGLEAERVEAQLREQIGSCRQLRVTVIDDRGRRGPITIEDPDAIARLAEDCQVISDVDRSGTVLSSNFTVEVETAPNRGFWILGDGNLLAYMTDWSLDLPYRDTHNMIEVDPAFISELKKQLGVKWLYELTLRE